MLGFHPEFACQRQQHEHRRAEGEDVSYAGELSQGSADEQSQDLGGKDAGHEGAADAPHQFRRGLLLHQGLGRDDDAGYRAADEEVAQQGAPDAGEKAEQYETDSDAQEARVDQCCVPNALAVFVERVDAYQHADADHRARDAVYCGRGVDGVSDVDCDERSEATDDKHTRGHGQHNKEQSRVMENEVHSLLHVVEHFGDCPLVFRGGVLVYLGAALDDGGGDEARRGEEADGVQPVADVGAEVGDKQTGGGRADDSHAEHDSLHEGIGRAEAVERYGFSYHHALGWPEKAGDNADGGKDRVEVPDLRGHEQKQAEQSADDVT